MRFHIISAITLLALVTACNDSNNDKSSAWLEDASQSAQESYLSDITYDVRHVETLVFMGDRLSIENQIMTYGDFTSSLRRQELITYDEYNRFIGAEVKVFPDPSFDGESNLAPEGSITQKLVQTYPDTGDAKVILTTETWDNWSDGGSGKKTSKVVREELNFQQGLPSLIRTETTNFSDDGSILSDEKEEKKLHFNSQNLWVASDIERNSLIEDGFELTEVFDRYDDGTPFELYDDQNQTQRSWYFNSHHGLSNYRLYNNGYIFLYNDLTYLKIEGLYLLINERYYDFFGGGEIEVKIFEQGDCHINEINRHRYDYPEFSHCYSKSFWGE